MEHIETIIIGGGQAGLSTGYHLKQRDLPFVILDAQARLGDQWRRHYDTLTLYSPARYDGLPGLDFPGDPAAFPRRDEVAAYIEQYAMFHELSVRTNARVLRLDRRAGGGFLVELEGGTMACENVVVAVGNFGVPYVPEGADGLDASIVQIHSADYKRPSQLPSGPVLVVGGAHSGTDIAYELAATHSVTLCGRDPGQMPFRPEDRKARFMFPVVVFAWRHILTRRTPIGRKVMANVRAHGGPMVRVHRDDLASRGVQRLFARFVGSEDGQPLLDDGTVVPASTVVWATGYEHAYDWIAFPVLGADGWPAEMRGVAPDVPGLFYCGLPFQYAFGSMVFPGVGRDADYVARCIAERVHNRSKAPQSA